MIPVGAADYLEREAPEVFSDGEESPEESTVESQDSSSSTEQKYDLNGFPVGVSLSDTALKIDRETAQYLGWVLFTLVQAKQILTD